MYFDEDISLSSLNRILETRLEKVLCHTRELDARNEELDSLNSLNNDLTNSNTQNRYPYYNTKTGNYSRRKSSRERILDEISTLPTFSQRLSGFLDYTIDYSSFLHQEIWNIQSSIHKVRDEICQKRSQEFTIKSLNSSRDKEDNEISTRMNDSMIETRLNKLSTMLQVKPKDIETALDDLISLEKREQNRDSSFSDSIIGFSSKPTVNSHESEYHRCLRLVSGERGSLSYIIRDLQHKISRTQSIHNTTKEKFSSYSTLSNNTPLTPHLPQKTKDGQTESPPQQQFVSDM